MKTRTHLALVALSVAGIAHASHAPKSLFERLGGTHNIAAFVSDSVDAHAKNETLLMNPRLKMAVENKVVGVFMITRWVISASGGPSKDSDCASFVRWLDFSEDENKISNMLDREAMAKHGVSMADMDELQMKLNKQVSMAKPVGPTAETFKAKDSLYARLGGIVPIVMVVDEFVNQLAQDPTILGNQNTTKSLSSGKVSAAGIKYLVSEQVAAASGGPYKYTGRSMKESHKELMISENEWAATGAIFKRVLDKFMVPEREQKELFAIIGSTKKDIIGG